MRFARSRHSTMSLTTKITRIAAELALPPTRYMTRVDVPNMLRDSESIETRTVFLTFDDGPYADRTDRVLDALAASNAKATFFVIGQRAVEKPETVRRIVNEGHRIGTHTWSHVSARKMSARQYVEDAKRARNEVEQIVGLSVPLFRPPYGELTPLALAGLLRNSFRIVHWSHDTKDFEATSTKQLTESCRNNPPDNRDIILMHDDREITSQTVGDILHGWSEDTKFCALPLLLTDADQRDSQIGLASATGVNDSPLPRTDVSNKRNTEAVVR